MSRKGWIEMVNIDDMNCNHRSSLLQFSSEEDKEGNVKVFYVITCRKCGANGMRVEKPNVVQLTEIRDQVFKGLLEVVLDITKASGRRIYLIEDKVNVIDKEILLNYVDNDGYRSDTLNHIKEAAVQILEIDMGSDFEMPEDPVQMIKDAKKKGVETLEEMQEHVESTKRVKIPAEQFVIETITMVSDMFKSALESEYRSENYLGWVLAKEAERKKEEGNPNWALEKMPLDCYVSPDIQFPDSKLIYKKEENE